MGQLFKQEGSALNLAELNARRAADLPTQLLAIDAGFRHIFFGYVFYYLAVPIGFVCLFFSAKRVVIKLGWL